jgi:hypothetical protein
VPPRRRVLVDDRLLIEQLLVGGLRVPAAGMCTTMYWYYRACRAAVAGAGGHLSGPFERLAADQQRRAILTLLELPEAVALPDPRVVVPMMAQVATRHPHLNLLNVEAVAAARALSARVWLSQQSAAGVLPGVLDSEGIEWRTIDID